MDGNALSLIFLLLVLASGFLAFSAVLPATVGMAKIFFTIFLGLLVGAMAWNLLRNS